MSNPNDSERTWTVGGLLNWTTAWFADKQIEGGRLAAELLLARALQCPKIDLYTRYGVEPTAEQRATFRELLGQAAEHTPIAYLLGEREFFSLPFDVTPAVLIPRPETEALVQRTIELCRESPERIWHVLDVGTGSGCIAISIAKFAPNTQIVGSDFSAEALEVAAGNVARHGMGERVTLVEADGLKNLPAACVPQDGFDVIVSNPPYISDAVWPTLPANIREHEPKIALTGPGGDGLEMYRRFAAEVPARLAEGGRLLAEMGDDQHEAVRAIFEAAGGWQYLTTHRDPNDPHDRVVELQRT